MAEYKKELKIESNYLDETLAVIENKLEQELDNIAIKRENLIAARRDMYDSTPHSSQDFEQIVEMVQQLSPLQTQTHDYEATAKRIRKYEKLLDSPYFARVDFSEEGLEKESIYIGLANLMDDKTYNIYVYDWRVPISSIFYRYELGDVSYNSPSGTIKGEVTLKRQYEIKNSKLEYFFDSSVNVIDDILKKALSGNTSSKMNTIVESIQREQDIIIRDIDNDLVIVQGVAGSGKTSVALHRVAFLMYQGLTEKLKSNNIVLISPNYLFGQYISNVLPELGEENIATLTFEDLFTTICGNIVDIKSRTALLEKIISTDDIKKKELLKASIQFKLSKEFITILDRFIQHFERKMIDFTDIHYNGQCVVTRDLLKADILKKEKKSVPIEKRLEQINTKITNRLQELRKGRLKKLEKFVHEHTDHPFHEKAFARLLSLKESIPLRKTIDKFTKIDYLPLYKKLFADKDLFYRLGRGLNLPEDIEQILNETNKNLGEEELSYEDAMGFICLKLKMTGLKTHRDIKQVVVDEAQDYYPIHFEILKLLFKDAKYTVVGDVNQTIEKQTDISSYELLKSILKKQKSTTVYMNKSFRCSHEINTFSSRFVDSDIHIESFDRHGEMPNIVHKESVSVLDNTVVEDVKKNQSEGYRSIAIICKSMTQATKLYESIKDKIDVQLISEYSSDTTDGIIIVPIYMAKGLEFDSVLVYGVDDKNFKADDDKNLLYIACTRALHKLSLYYTGEISKFLI
ncbi:AAA family ATPase [Alkalicella caledoniensis]|uniref:AAA family ATPase n=1 Tax=Alkalicella caledoniensis TaxID=2731377 RepID=A0A7G9W9Q9_ALKCA|nr:UvrD-helicase domain-containing protein [Alkalicella caledoniensis]QNO15421.1 AAA family ATPase [Alkalicella caledoniensis]